MNTIYLILNNIKSNNNTMNAIDIEMIDILERWNFIIKDMVENKNYICDNCLQEFKYIMGIGKHIWWDSYVEFACSRECGESLINNHK